MNELAFWNSWAKPYKNLFLMLLALLAGSIIYFIINACEPGEGKAASLSAGAPPCPYQS